MSKVWAVFVLVCWSVCSSVYWQSPAQAADVAPPAPAAAADPALHQLRQRLAADANDMDALVDLGQRYLDLAARSGDQRYLGYTRQLLAGRALTQTPVILLAARLQQRQHRFTAASALLEPLLRTQPHNAEAHLLQAYIDMARGRPLQALPHCAAAMSGAGTVASVHCAARARSLAGGEREARQLLLRLRRHRESTPEQQRDIAMTLAEIAERLHQRDEAEALLRDVLRLDPANRIARKQLAHLSAHTQ